MVEFGPAAMGKRYLAEAKDQSKADGVWREGEEPSSGCTVLPTALLDDQSSDAVMSISFVEAR